jgi:hypothetical protein
MDNTTKLIVEKRNAELFLRPRFSIDLDETSDVVIQRFSHVFKLKKTDCRGVIVDQHIFISVPKKDEHFWSPQLHLEFIDKENNTIEMKGLFGPKPQVWTFFMFIHFAISVSFIVFAAMLYSKISIKENIIFPLLMMFFLPLIWVLLYVLGTIGKDVGKPQIKQLHEIMIQIIMHQLY